MSKEVMNVNGWIITEDNGYLKASKRSFRSVSAPVSSLMQLIEVLPEWEANQRNEMRDRINKMFAK